MEKAFSVRRTRSERIALSVVTVICAAVAIWLNWSSWFTSADRIDPGGIWFARAAGLLFIVAFVMVLRAVRYSIWLDDDRLVRQGALLRRRVAIRTATFQIKESTRFGSITAPTLVVRTSAISRIRLPLAQRTGHQAIGDRVIVAGLPPDEIGPLVDAIYRYATAPNQERIARYLRARAQTPSAPSPPAPSSSGPRSP